MGTLLIFTRDTIRAAHRPGTWLQRVGLSALLLGAVVAASTWGVPGGRAAAQDLGRDLFQGWIIFTVFLAVFAAPVLVASGLDEEADEGTLDLLLLSRQRVSAVLMGKLLSRLAILFAVILAGVPPLAMVLGLGGVGPGEVVWGVTYGLVFSVVFGLFGGAIALVIRGTAWPFVGGVAWAGTSFVLVPGLCYELAPSRSAGPNALDWGELLSPFAAFAGDVQGGWPLVLQVIAVVGVVVGALLAAAIPRGRTSPLVQLAWAAWLVHIPVVGATALVGLALAAWVLPRSHPSVALAGLPLVIALEYALAGAGLALLVFVQRARGARRRWRPLRRWVWPNPVLWHELTSPSGARAASRVMLGLWVLTLLVFAASADTLSELARLVPRAGSVFGFCALLGMCAVLATASVVEERGRTLELLAVTTLHPLRVVWGKLLALAVRTGPFFVLVAVLWGLGWSTGLVQLLAAVAWLGVLWLGWSLLMLAMALRVPRRAAWPVNLMLSAAATAGIFALLALRQARSWSAYTLWAPLDGRSDPTQMLLAVQLWAGAVTLLLLVLGWRWRAWSTADR